MKALGSSLLVFLLLSCAKSQVSVKDQGISLGSKQSPTTEKITKNNEVEKFDDYIAKGNQYAIDGLYREALQSYRRALRKDSSNHAAHRMIGIISVKTGEYKKAIKHLELVNDSLRDDFEGNYYLAEAYRTQDRYGDAIFRYKVALSQKPKHALSLKALSWSYYKIRYYRAALKTATILNKVSPNDTQVTIILARVLNKVGQNRKALMRIRRAMLKAKPEQLPYLKSVLGDVYLSAGNSKKAEEAYKEALKEQPLLAGALLGLAKITLEKGQNVEAAITYLERATRIKPSLVEAFFYLGKAHSEKKPSISKRYFQRFSRMASGDPEYKEKISQAKLFLSKAKRLNGSDTVEEKL